MIEFQSNLAAFYALAPVPTVVSQSTLQNAAPKPNGPVVYQPSVASAGQKPILPNTSSKEQSFVSSKAIDDANRSQITREESIKLAGTFQYATNNSEPAQFDVEDVTLGYILLILLHNNVE